MFDNWQTILAVVLSVSGVVLIADLVRPTLGIPLPLPVTLAVAAALEGLAYFLNRGTTVTIISLCLLAVGVYMYVEQARADSEVARKRENA